MTSEILKKYGDRVSLAYFDFPLRPVTMQAAEAARCAGRQGRFWEYHDWLFRTVRTWGRARNPRRVFNRGAADLGLDPGGFSACMDTHATREAIERDRSLGESLGVNSTPTYYINEKRFVGYLPLSDFEREIRAALGETGQSN